MVTEVHRNDEIFYLCDVCGFAYKEKELAEKCQSWCEQHQSCNLEITQHGVLLE